MKNEGPKSLYQGLTPALTRSVVYGGLRLGLYEPSKYACDLAFGSSNVLVKIASGMFAGAIATALTNPMEVLKVSLISLSIKLNVFFFPFSSKSYSHNQVRLQMNPDMRKSGPVSELRRTLSEEGIRALWKGVGPAMARAAVLTASQLATYDETKQVNF